MVSFTDTVSNRGDNKNQPLGRTEVELQFRFFEIRASTMKMTSLPWLHAFIYSSSAVNKEVSSLCLLLMINLYTLTVKWKFLSFFNHFL